MGTTKTEPVIVSGLAASLIAPSPISCENRPLWKIKRVIGGTISLIGGAMMATGGSLVVITIPALGIPITVAAVGYVVNGIGLVITGFGWGANNQKIADKNK